MTMLRKSMVYAHRGANREAAENTRSAFNRALEYKVDGIETDIQLSRDGVPVLWHDRFLGKLGHPVKRIDDYNYSELQQMNFAAHGKHEGIMSLSEFFDAYRQRCRLLLEIKNREGEEESRQQAKVRLTLEQSMDGRNNGIIVSSFHLPSLIYANQLNADFPLIYNCEKSQTVDGLSQILNSCPFLYGFCLHKDTLRPSMVDLLRSHNKCIAVYTCNSDREIKLALDMAVDILISDVPQTALQMRET